jgi:formylglycine-generating enzyme required for sulfatase activity
LRGLLERVLGALSYLHERGIYHRDIKPGNILITKQNAPVLIDFGSARQRLSERSMTVVESPGYTPFEQLQSRGNVGPWSDLYALGGTLVKVMTGETPPKAMDRMRKDPYQELVGLVDLKSRFKNEFLGAIDKALAVDEEERWQDAGEWQVALRGETAVLPVADMPEHDPVTASAAVESAPITGSEKKTNFVPWAIATCMVLGLIAVGKCDSNDKEEVVTAQARETKQRATQAELAREKAAKILAAASKEKPFENSLEMKFVPVGIQINKKTVLFSIWETRVKDYEAYANANRGVNTEWKNPRFEQTGEHPVVCVSYEDAVAFCAWLTKRERSAGKIGSGDEYRLPSDEEWSFAVGIGEKEDAKAMPKEKDAKIEDVWPWVTRWPPPEGAGNYDSHSSSKITADGYDRTSPVGKFQKNTHGLYDLGGNVWEWCGSYYDGSSESRVLRGGSWGDCGRVVLFSSYRDFYYPGYRGNYYGFRCVVVSSR